MMISQGDPEAEGEVHYVILQEVWQTLILSSLPQSNPAFPFHADSKNSIAENGDWG